MFETTIEHSIPCMAELYHEPHVESENWIIRTFEIERDNWAAIYNNGILPGKYVSLNSKNKKPESYIENTCMMSDTPMERFTNQEFVNIAEGRVLIAGLGIGMVPAALAQKEEVSHITIIELDQEIINLVEPLIRKYVENNEKIEIIQADANTFPETYNGPKFDYLWLDIWPEFPNTEEDFEMFESMFNMYDKIMTMPRMNGWGYDYAAAVGYGIDEINPIETDAFIDYCHELLFRQNLKNMITNKSNITEAIIDGKTVAI